METGREAFPIGGTGVPDPLRVTDQLLDIQFPAMPRALPNSILCTPWAPIPGGQFGRVHVPYAGY
jgi:hypothetical protein